MGGQGEQKSLPRRWETTVIESKTERPATMSGQVTGVWRTALLAGAAAVFMAGQVVPADAQFFRQYQPQPQSRQDTTKAGKTANRPPATQSKRDVPIRQPFGENMPKGPLQLMVSIADQRAVLYSNGIRVAEAKVSTGTASHPTPTGVFSIIQKNRWHRSNLYGSAPMFYMHRLTWSGIALHEGHLPGFAASHGCIRMPTDFVSRLWNVSKMGMRVVVARVEVRPEEFSHAKLFNPAPKPVDPSRTSEMPEGLRPSFDTTGQGLVRIAQAEPADAEAAVATDAPSAAATTDTAAEPPIATTDSAIATSPTATDTAVAPAVVDAPAATDVAATPAAPVVIDVPAATEVAATPAAPAAVSEPVTTSTVAAPAPEAAPVAPAPTPAAATSEPERPAVNPNELSVPRPAPLRARTAEPPKLNGQVAVFISGKEKRIFVRHAFVPLFDMPIEIANPGKSLGTHTYTALELQDGGARMRWNVVSMPLTAGQAAPAASSKKGAPKQQQQQQQPKRAAKHARGAVVTSASSNATDALDRVTIPQEAIDRISELLTPGSSLIISDEGLGRETGRYTEFIVEMR
jgi:lipoprotein-anchoring transpeptidase ErfK/SrfK